MNETVVEAIKEATAKLLAAVAELSATIAKIEANTRKK